MVPHAFDDGGAAGVANAETFAAFAIGKKRTAGGAVHDGIAEDNALVRGILTLRDRLDDDFSAAHALADDSRWPRR